MPLNIPTDLSQSYTRFGVTIGRLKLHELEFLRERRNDPELARFMIFRDEITPEQQLAWFHSVDNRKNLYGTVYWQGRFIGMTNLKDIDEVNCSAEGGMLIWDPECQNSIVPFRAALVGTDLAFWGYWFQSMTARVLATNTRALRFNRALGYRFEPPDENGVMFGRVTNPQYWRATMNLRKVLDEQDGTINGGENLPPIIYPLPPDG
jgi:RimJ/RimL family protein N-acetyltransferase